LVEKAGGPGENHRPAESHWQTLMLHWLSTLHLSGIQTHNVSQWYALIA
jgi:hypothetical protein